MATSPKLQQSTTIFTEENISKNTFYILLIVCLGYFMHTNAFNSMFGNFLNESSSAKSTAEYPSAKKIKVAKASIGAVFESENRSDRRPTALASNTILTGKNKTKKNANEEILSNRKMVVSYAKKYAAVAKIEEREMAIPASITLAQGIMESAAGTSKLAQMANNHFAKVCHSRHCKKGHCRNIVPDAHKDFFVVYQSAWQSYREHSESLYKEDRYQKLYSIPKKDYKAWAKGLEKAGYSKEKNYASKLIYLIETYHLDKI